MIYRQTCIVCHNGSQYVLIKTLCPICVVVLVLTHDSEHWYTSKQMSCYLNRLCHIFKVKQIVNIFCRIGTGPLGIWKCAMAKVWRHKLAILLCFLALKVKAFQDHCRFPVFSPGWECDVKVWVLLKGPIARERAARNSVSIRGGKKGSNEANKKYLKV